MAPPLSFHLIDGNQCRMPLIPIDLSIDSALRRCISPQFCFVLFRYFLLFLPSPPPPPTHFHCEFRRNQMPTAGAHL